MAWNGRVAEGPAELHLDLVKGNETPEQVITLAYGMEMALADFYRMMAQRGADADVAALLEKLASIEDKHKQYLLDLYQSTLGTEPDVNTLQAAANTRMLEGGLDAATLAQENQRVLQSVTGLLELAMMLETQALDLYLRFAGNIESGAARKVLFSIADEEKAHLAALGKMLEDKIA